MVYTPFDITGRTAIITGGARGIGLACTKALIESHVNVAIFDVLKPTEDLEQINSSNVKITSYICDIEDLEILASTFAKFEEDFEDFKLDIVVLCAGINMNIPFLETTTENYNKLANINSRGCFFACQYASKVMIKKGVSPGKASIIFIASMGSYIAIRSQFSSAYCSTKGSVRAMVAPISAELQKYGIRCNSISPGYIKTKMTEPFPKLLDDWKGLCMNERVGEPVDIAGCCVFLASDASNYMSGEDIVIDAGVTKW